MPRKHAADEIDDLVDGLDALDEDEEDVVEVEEDPDEAPKKKGRTRKPSTKEPKVREGIGTAEIAEAAGITQRSLRMFLRAQGYQPRDEREGRYTWKSLNDPEAKQILKAIRTHEADKANKEALAEAKEKPAAKTRKRSLKVVDEEEEVDED